MPEQADEYTRAQRAAWWSLDEVERKIEADMAARFGPGWGSHDGHYVLDGDSHVPRRTTLGEWAVWLEAHGDRKRVAETTLPDGRWVSTVFLGLDHGFGDGPPILFETMVFRGEGDLADEYQERCSTWEEALLMHERAIAYASGTGT